MKVRSGHLVRPRRNLRWLGGAVLDAADRRKRGYPACSARRAVFSICRAVTPSRFGRTAGINTGRESVVGRRSRQFCRAAFSRRANELHGRMRLAGSPSTVGQSLFEYQYNNTASVGYGSSRVCLQCCDRLNLAQGESWPSMANRGSLRT